MNYFHFSIGPVQEFVSQARRTRDFWAGSFLLSWLAGVAMAAVQAQNGQIIFPQPAEDYLDWIRGTSKPSGEAQQSLARVGAIPNRFAAEVQTDFVPEQVVDAVYLAWQGLAELCLKRDGIALSEPAAKVWRRQILQRPGLWEIQWLVLEGENQANALNARKHWRSHMPGAAEQQAQSGTGKRQRLLEGGQKCSLMQGWQELSGRPANGGRIFWQNLSLNYPADFAEGEQLCAPALIKRRFAAHFEYLDLQLSPSLRIAGWRLPRSVPSTHHLAAVPWLEKLIRASQNQPSVQAKMKEFVDAANLAGIKGREGGVMLQRLAQAMQAANPSQQIELATNLQQLVECDASVFYLDALRNAQEFEKCRGLEKQLKGLQACVPNQAGVPREANKFYALLLMDGDSLGRQITHAAEALARGLKHFTAGVQAIVAQHSGFLVYAGGDDVFALLPTDQALSCALQLRQHYLACFAAETSIQHASISAAIIFADSNIPLTQLIKKSHQLLDEVAKQAHGRDSLAVQVWKNSGLHLNWGMPWQKALNARGDKLEIQILLEEMLRQRQITEEGEQASRRSGVASSLFSNGFFRRAKELFETMHTLIDEASMKTLLLYEYGHSLNAQGNPLRSVLRREELADILEPLYQQSRFFQRQLHADGHYHFQAQGAPRADAALLLSFLVHASLDESVESNHAKY